MVQAERDIETGIAHGCAFGIQHIGPLVMDDDVLRAHIAMDQNLPRGIEPVGDSIHGGLQCGVGSGRMDKIGLDADGVEIVAVPERFPVKAGRCRECMDPPQQIADSGGVACRSLSRQQGSLEKIAVRRGQIFHYETMFPVRMSMKPDSGIRGYFGDCLQPSVFRQIAFDGREPVGFHPQLRKCEFHAI